MSYVRATYETVRNLLILGAVLVGGCVVIDTMNSREAKLAATTTYPPAQTQPPAVFKAQVGPNQKTGEI